MCVVVRREDGGLVAVVCVALEVVDWDVPGRARVGAATDHGGLGLRVIGGVR